jgi:hypothetical protein
MLLISLDVRNVFILSVFRAVIFRVVGYAVMPERIKMLNVLRVSPPNSLLFISDLGGGETPHMTRGPRIWATPTCIAVGCLAFMDGETEVSMGKMEEVDPGGSPVFDGYLETPNRSVIVSTVDRSPILDAAVSNFRTRVKIWTNHPKEPDRIRIGLS